MFRKFLHIDREIDENVQHTNIRQLKILLEIFTRFDFDLYNESNLLLFKQSADHCDHFIVIMVSSKVYTE